MWGTYILCALTIMFLFSVTTTVYKMVDTLSDMQTTISGLDKLNHDFSKLCASLYANNSKLLDAIIEEKNNALKSLKEHKDLYLGKCNRACNKEQSNPFEEKYCLDKKE